jgi:hypothetical protein
LQRKRDMRHHLKRYSPEICAQLRAVAEQRHWHVWDKSAPREEILEEVELTYHLHLAAEAMGARAGFPTMPSFPFRFLDSEGILDPAEFLHAYRDRHSTPWAWNQSDNGPHTGLAA